MEGCSCLSVFVLFYLTPIPFPVDSCSNAFGMHVDWPKSLFHFFCMMALVVLSCL